MTGRRGSTLQRSPESRIFWSLQRSRSHCNTRVATAIVRCHANGRVKSVADGVKLFIFAPFRQFGTNPKTKKTTPVNRMKMKEVSV